MRAVRRQSRSLHALPSAFCDITSPENHSAPALHQAPTGQHMSGPRVAAQGELYELNLNLIINFWSFYVDDEAKWAT
jgi:hypothetical protein